MNDYCISSNFLTIPSLLPILIVYTISSPALIPSSSIPGPNYPPLLQNPSVCTIILGISTLLCDLCMCVYVLFSIIVSSLTAVPVFSMPAQNIDIFYKYSRKIVELMTTHSLYKGHQRDICSLVLNSPSVTY